MALASDKAFPVGLAAASAPNRQQSCTILPHHFNEERSYCRGRDAERRAPIW